MKAMSIILSALALTACQTSRSTPKVDELTPTTNRIAITISGNTLTATLAPTTAAQAFASMLPLTLTMDELNGNEKYTTLPERLPSSANHSGSINSGDIMLFGSSTLVLFYESFRSSYSYTKIGTIDDPSTLQTALGAASATIKFERK